MNKMSTGTITRWLHNFGLQQFERKRNTHSAGTVFKRSQKLRYQFSQDLLKGKKIKMAANVR